MQTWQAKAISIEESHEEMKLCRDRITRENVALQKEIASLQLALILIQNETINKTHQQTKSEKLISPSEQPKPIKQTSEVINREAEERTGAKMTAGEEVAPATTQEQEEEYIPMTLPTPTNTPPQAEEVETPTLLVLGNMEKPNQDKYSIS